MWVIVAPAGKRIKVEIMEFGLEQAFGCYYDYLKVMFISSGVVLIYRELKQNTSYYGYRNTNRSLQGVPQSKIAAAGLR